MAEYISRDDVLRKFIEGDGHDDDRFTEGYNMTIDEAIRHCEEVAEQEECFINYPHSDIVLGDLDIESRKHFVAEQKQIAEWLIELKESREQIFNLKLDNERLRDCVDICVRNSELDYAELAEAKRLLKLAVEDIHELLCDKKNLDGNGQSCNICSYIEWCPCCKECTIREDLRNWRYSDEVEKLLNNPTETCKEIT